MRGSLLLYYPHDDKHRQQIIMQSIFGDFI